MDLKIISDKIDTFIKDSSNDNQQLNCLTQGYSLASNYQEMEECQSLPCSSKKRNLYGFLLLRYCQINYQLLYKKGQKLVAK